MSYRLNSSYGLAWSHIPGFQERRAVGHFTRGGRKIELRFLSLSVDLTDRVKKSWHEKSRSDYPTLVAGVCSQ